jgi:hypothetical protein
MTVLKSLFFYTLAVNSSLMKRFSKICMGVLCLLLLSGTGYLIYQFSVKGAYYEYKTRYDVKNEPKTTFTYYFFWYDNNSGGDATETVHIYNNPQGYYKISNSTLINQTFTIANNAYLLLNISELNLANYDFDMFQVQFNSTTEPLTLFGIQNSDYAKFLEDPMNQNSQINRFEYRSATSGFLRIPFRKSNVTTVAIQNFGLNPVQFSIIGKIFNDTLSHHPDPSKFRGDFSYKNVNWHKYELENIMRAGIDVILPIYWGSWSGEFNTIGMQYLVDALKLMEAEYGLAAIPKVGMFMDTTGFLVARGTEPDLTTEDGKMLFSKFVNEFFAFFPEKYLFHINGAELVWMYGANFIKKIDDSTFDYARLNYTATFGATRNLEFVGVGFMEDARRTQLGAYSWGVSLGGANLNRRGIAIGSIGPGFYAEGAYRCGCQFDLGIRTRERQGGQYYIDSFHKVIQGSQWIVIEVWNEYHEGNDISYTMEYKDLYINLTQQLIKEFHATQIIDWRDNDSIITATVIVAVIFFGVLIKEKRKELKK